MFHFHLKIALIIIYGWIWDSFIIVPIDKIQEIPISCLFPYNPPPHAVRSALETPEG